MFNVFWLLNKSTHQGVHILFIYYSLACRHLNGNSYSTRRMYISILHDVCTFELIIPFQVI